MQQSELGSDRGGNSGRVVREVLGGGDIGMERGQQDVCCDTGNSKCKGLRRALRLFEEQKGDQCGQTAVGKWWGWGWGMKPVRGSPSRAQGEELGLWSKCSGKPLNAREGKQLV